MVHVFGLRVDEGLKSVSFFFRDMSVQVDIQMGVFYSRDRAYKARACFFSLPSSSTDVRTSNYSQNSVEQILPGEDNMSMKY